MRKATAASALGNATEWYDYGIYAVATGYISYHFFDDFENATLLTLATFAISFVVRPLGGLIWGPLGDRMGRKTILAITILLMSGATFGIGLLPTAQTIGVWAPILLVLLRMIQGFSTGGEYGGAATYMAEYAPDQRRGFFGSFLEFGTMGGFALGTAVMLLFQLVLTPEQMNDFGWRIPFLLGAPLGLIGFYLRSKLDDSPVFTELQEQGAEAAEVAEDTTMTPQQAEELAATAAPEPAPGLIQLVKDHWKVMLILGGLVISVNVVNYTLLTYMPTYFEHQLGMESQTGLTIVLIGQVLMMALIPTLGTISDHTGRKPLWYFSLLGLLVLAIPMFLLVNSGFAMAIIGFAVLGVLYIPQLATITATFPAMFPTNARYSGFAITYNISTSIFGGTAALINEWGIGATGDVKFPAYYMMGACLVGLVCAWFMSETAGASLRGTEIPGAVGSAVAEGSPAETALETGSQPQQRNLSDEEMEEIARQMRESMQPSTTKGSQSEPDPTP